MKDVKVDESLFGELLTENAEVLKFNKNVTKRIEKLLKNEEIDAEDINLLNSYKADLILSYYYMSKIGYTVPYFLVDDAMNLNNYIKYFDSIFYTQKAIETSREQRICGHKKLDELAKEHVFDLFSENELSNMNNDDLNYALKISKFDVLIEKVSQLASTKELLNKVKKEKNFIRQEIESKVNEIESKVRAHQNRKIITQ